MQREQKTEKPGYPAVDRVELEVTQGVQSIEVRKTVNEDSATEAMIREMSIWELELSNLRFAGRKPKKEPA
jgi:hypothetical protein